jgi:flagellar basal-body rod protein FlgB
MIFDRVFGTPVVAALKKGLECATVRHEAIANNIANVSTPYYKRQDVQFEDQLWEALSGEGKDFKLTTTHPRHFNGTVRRVEQVQPRLKEEEGDQFRIDRNTVDIDREMVELAKNSGQFAQRSELLSRYYSQVRTAIRGEVR